MSPDNCREVRICMDPEPDQRTRPVSVEATISLRDFLAAQALAGMLASQVCPVDIFEEMATDAYRLADHMLKARGEAL
jgi:hypothetical protein